MPPPSGAAVHLMHYGGAFEQAQRLMRRANAVPKTATATRDKRTVTPASAQASAQATALETAEPAAGHDVASAAVAPATAASVHAHCHARPCAGAAVAVAPQAEPAQPATA